MKKAMLIVAGIVMLAGPVLAGGPNLAIVPADATWAVCINMEAVVASSMAKDAMALIDAQVATIGQDKVTKADNLWLKLQGVKDVTVFGFGMEKVGVVVVNAAYDPAQVRKMAGVADDATPVAPGIYSFTPKCSPDQQAWIFLGKDVIVGSNNLDRLKTAVGLQGATAAAKHPLADLLIPTEGSFMVAAIQNPLKADAVAEENPGPLGLLRKASTGRVEVGQKGDNLFGTLALTMANEKDAKELVQTAEGLLAVALLSIQQNDAGAAKLAEGIKLSADGAVANATVSVPVADILAKAKAKMAAAAARAADKPDVQ